MSSMPYDREVVRCPSTRPILWSCSGMLRTLTLRNLRSTGSCSALTIACMQRLGFDASNLARCRPKGPHSRGGAYQWGSDQDSSETSRVGFIWNTVAPDTSETYVGISWLPEGIHFHYTPMTATSAADTLSGTTASATASPATATV
jgi:hypothetical protein